MVISVRRAVSDDWAAMRAIRLRSLTEAPLAFGSTLAREQDLTNESWRRRIESAMAFLAFESGEVVGTATGLVENVDDVHLVAMFVLERTRGRGCAALLIDAVVAAAGEVGCRRVVLDVAAPNDAARRAYVRYGFVWTGERSTLEHAPQIEKLRLAFALS